MYINFKVLNNSLLHVEDIIFLLAIKQKETEFLIETYWKESYNRLEARSFIEYIKSIKKSDHKYTGLRLSKAGKNFLEALGKAEATEEDKKVYEWLKSHYKKIGKDIGNGAKTLRHIQDFRIKSGIEKNNLIKLLLGFLNDEENMEYNHKLEYLLYKAPTAFETRFNLEESRLYKYYIKRQTYFDNMFEKY